MSLSAQEVIDFIDSQVGEDRFEDLVEERALRPGFNQFKNTTLAHVEEFVSTLPPDILRQVLFNTIAHYERAREVASKSVQESRDERKQSRFTIMMEFAEFIRDDSLIEDPLRFGIAVGQFIQK